ncbi:hypothetical protein [Salimicrobium halophilum]|uniref:Uncharacterized protein n=1 Tax=Salimicrobium halophilum TaxID=86666 RepID=A0A1G8RD02_9BACI|nr:hypothetical protein [Salimicrobium halophilum]SDJ14924.1 hypothetical protein SAMN04490247_0964 [Salimicrobium halophilum]
MIRWTLAIVLIITIGFYIWQSMGSTSLEGESEHWRASYEGYKEGKFNYREYRIIYTGKEEIKGTDITYSIESDHIQTGQEGNLQKTDKLEGKGAEVTTVCGSCRIAMKSGMITIEVQWADHKERLVLE